MRNAFTLGCIASLSFGTAFAQQPAAPAKTPPAALALEAVQAAVAACSAHGYNVGATVIDSSGFARVVFSSDSARGSAVEASFRKAYTAFTFKSSTAAIEAQAAADPAFAAKVAADPKMLARGGGLPIVVGGELIGAIGVGGAPDRGKDNACAEAGLAQIQDRLR